MSTTGKIILIAVIVAVVIAVIVTIIVLATKKNKSKEKEDYALPVYEPYIAKNKNGETDVLSDYVDKYIQAELGLI